MTKNRHDLSLSVNDPSLPWNMDLTTAKEVMIIFMRDIAQSPEEVEVYCQLGAMARLGWIEHVLKQQRADFIRKKKKAQRVAKKGTKP